ncbi:LuxR C-terminal-related transcriptional regulator [uncultured Dysgonomonas sp.]|uniref:Transcriptional regulator, LuxR family n=1 Tax=uncultured Dysgonomonas sp. TaxID=206096 RepID=A0A212JT13_9BACT|nr:LuxR C-terminal-related transcriptional regulator [uncultured Dysgonomonas sp.]SBW02478.1 Transcriptional regulator, LuxR family [uncultured Dysgonomonas sp.]
MDQHDITPEELWSRQQISGLDVDYDLWNEKRESIREFARISGSCIFTVDVFQRRYDFASESFSAIFGYEPEKITVIQEHGDFLEERIHPDDRKELTEYQIEHGQFIYSLPPEQRNDYKQIFQLRMLNTKKQYINVISRHQVIQTDKNGKAWIVMGIMEISPNQLPTNHVKRTVVNIKTNETLTSLPIPVEKQLTKREKEILLLIRQGHLSKEIADKLNLSIYTVNNHRKNILAKLHVDNAMEAVNLIGGFGAL